MKSQYKTFNSHCSLGPPGQIKSQYKAFNSHWSLGPPGLFRHRGAGVWRGEAHQDGLQSAGLRQQVPNVHPP